MRKSNSYKEHLLKRLRDPKEAAAYLNAALEDEDPRVFLIALKDIAEAHGGLSKLAQKSACLRAFKQILIKSNSSDLDIRPLA